MDYEHIVDTYNDSITPYDAPVEMKPSKYGNGLFATRDIKTGELITHYPCDFMYIDNKKTDKVELITHKDFTPFSFSIDEIGAYAFNIHSTKTENINIVGDPSLPFRPHLSGHIANDACDDIQDLIHKIYSPDRFVRAYIQYLHNIITKSNCNLIYKDEFVILEANRDIPNGTELRNSYGLQYWCKLGQDEIDNKVLKCRNKGLLKTLYDKLKLFK
jgi:hypothetical protein